MKLLTLIFAALMTIGLAQNAQADFGSFFTDEAPSALEGSPEDVLSEILGIEPAAGEEEGEEKSEDEEEESEDASESEEVEGDEDDSEDDDSDDDEEDDE